MEFKETLAKITAEGASDIFIVAGRPLSYKLHGQIVDEGERLLPDDAQRLVNEIYLLARNRELARLMEDGDDDFSFALPGVARFRINAFKQRGSLSAVIRVIKFSIPKPEDLGIPETIINFADKKKGFVLITGPAGSGKSTTLACMIATSTTQDRGISLHLKTLSSTFTSTRSV